MASATPRGRELAAHILAGCAGSPVGARLPTERQLAQQLGVTRAAVRHAFGVLEAQGWVSREVGRGTFLRATESAGGPELGRPNSAAVTDLGPADVMSARELFEPQILPLVVARATGRDFDELDRCAAGGDSAESAEEFEEWDIALHHAIAVAAHNSLVVRMYAAIESARQDPLWGTLKRRHDSAERRAAYQQDHWALVRALRTRELERAVDTLRVHLERVRVNLLGAAEISDSTDESAFSDDPL
jgi:GntR family transcriptional regulator, uxu operon transcriptional repressor